MIKSYRDIRNLTDSTKWEIDFINHNVVARNTQDQTIREIMIKKCSHYYKFDEILKKSLIVNSLYVIKFIRLNSQIKNVKENTKETNIISSTTRYKLESNVNNKKYENWLIKDLIFDSDFLSDNFLTQKHVNNKFKFRRISIISDTMIKKRVMINIDFDNEESQSKSIKREKNKSIANALMKVRTFKFKDFTR
jgi:phosphoribosylformylglycinamidine (FGAM) synthase PurS component